MNKTLEVLGRICDKYRFKEKLLFVPSYSIGHQIGEYLAKSGTSWINLRVTTVAGYAHELVSPELNEGDIRLIDPQERLLIIEKLFREEPAVYFKGAEEIPGIPRCFGKAIHDLRMAELTAAIVDPEAFIVRVKGEEVVRLLDAYERFLKENKLVDAPGMLGMAIEKLKKESGAAYNRVVMVLSDFPLTPLEKDFIHLVGGEDIIVIDHTRPHGLSFPARFLEVSEWNSGDSAKPKTDVDLIPWLFKPEKAPKPFGDSSVALFHALGEANEVREVFRRILSDGTSLDDVDILVTAIAPYISIIYETINALGIPATFASGIPVSYSRPGKALLLYLKWLAEDFGTNHLMRLFSGRYLDLNAFVLQGETPSPGKAAAIIKEAAIGWGRSRYESRLKALDNTYRQKAEEIKAEGEEEKAQRMEGSVNRVEWVTRFVEQLMATIPDVGPEKTVTLQEICTGAVDFLRRFCRVAGDLDPAAKLRLIDLLESLNQAPALGYPVEEAAERLIDLVAGISVGHASPKPGHVHIAHYRSGGHSGRSNTFVVGLDQNRFPGSQLQDPVILDVERQELGSPMVLASELLHEKVYVMGKVLCSVRGKLTLSYCCRDLREDREIFPSSVLLGVYRLIAGDRKGDYRALTGFLGEPAGFVPKAQVTPLNNWEWWLTQKAAQYGSDSVYASYQDLLEGDRAEDARDLETLGEFDGWIPSAAGAMDPFDKNVILSCSRLEGLAKCPYAFFIRYVLGIEPLEEMERDMSRWLEPIQRGELLHDVFCRFMTELEAKGERPSLKEHLKLIETIALEEVERWKKEIPPVGGFAFDHEVEDIMVAITIFLRDEEERCRQVEPLLFELSFGVGEDEGCGSFTKDPVVLEIPGKGNFRLRGRIDRVDRSGPHEYEVWDYKTGSTWGFKEHGYLNQGRHLQHALYAMAAEALLRKGSDKKAKVVRAGYFFPGHKGEGARIEKSQLQREELYEVLEDLFALLQKGVFPSARHKDDCGFCEYGSICGGPDVAVQRCTTKLAADKKLEPFQRLKQHA